MLDFLQMIASGIAVGSTYALMGIAMVIIYKTSEVPNFAQGEMALISSFFAFMLLDQYGLLYHLAFPAALVFSILLGFFLEFSILRRAKEPNILGLIVITIGIEMILLGLVSWKFGADPKTSGKVYLKDNEIAIRNPRDAVGNGICLLTEDRKDQGLISDMPCYVNITITDLAQVSRYGLLENALEKSASKKLVDDLGIKMSSIDQWVSNL